MSSSSSEYESEDEDSENSENPMSIPLKDLAKRFELPIKNVERGMLSNSGALGLSFSRFDSLSSWQCEISLFNTTTTAQVRRPVLSRFLCYFCLGCRVPLVLSYVSCTTVS